VNNTGLNAATQMISESALRHAYTGTVQLAPTSAGAVATRLPVVSSGWQGSRKRFADVPTQTKGSPQSRGRLAHT
jgi:hypothetical protein